MGIASVATLLRDDNTFFILFFYFFPFALYIDKIIRLFKVTVIASPAKGGARQSP